MTQRLLSKDFLDERLVPELETGTAQYFDHIRRYLFAQQFVQKKTVLDVACGTGYGSNILRLGRARQVISIDISPAALRYASRQWGVRGLLQADATCLPLRSGIIDVIVSFETLEHLAAPDSFLSEAARLLRPAGTLILSTPNRAMASPGSLIPFSPYHTFEPTLPELELLLKNAGWQIVELYGIVHSPRLEAIIAPASQAFAKTGNQIAWAAYLRRWLQNILPGALYQWQSRVRHIPQFGIEDSILTRQADEKSSYFVVRCQR